MYKLQPLELARVNNRLNDLRTDPLLIQYVNKNNNRNLSIEDHFITELMMSTYPDLLNVIDEVTDGTVINPSIETQLADLGYYVFLHDGNVHLNLKNELVIKLTNFLEMNDIYHFLKVKPKSRGLVSPTVEIKVVNLYH